MAFFQGRGPKILPTAAEQAAQQAIAGNMQQQKTLIGANTVAGGNLGQGVGDVFNNIGQSVFGSDSVFGIRTPQRQEMEFTRMKFDHGVAQLIEGGMTEKKAHEQMAAQFQQDAAGLLKTFAETKRLGAATDESKAHAGLLKVQTEDIVETREGRIAEQEAVTKTRTLANSLAEQVLGGQVMAENAKSQLVQHMADLEMSPQAQAAALKEFDARLAKAEITVESKEARLKLLAAEVLEAESSASLNAALSKLRKENINDIFQMELDASAAETDKTRAQTENFRDLKSFTERQLIQVDRKLEARILEAKANFDLKAQKNFITSRAALIQGFANLVAPFVKLEAEMEMRGQVMSPDAKALLKIVYDDAKDGVSAAVQNLMNMTKLKREGTAAPTSPVAPVDIQDRFADVDQELGR